MIVSNGVTASLNVVPVLMFVCLLIQITICPQAKKTAKLSAACGENTGRWLDSHGQKVKINQMLCVLSAAGSLWARRSTEGPLAQLSLSCKSAAVQDMTATALAGPLRGVEHFQGNHLKNDNLWHRWDINYTLHPWKISQNSRWDKRRRLC